MKPIQIIHKVFNNHAYPQLAPSREWNASIRSTLLFHSLGGAVGSGLIRSLAVYDSTYSCLDALRLRSTLCVERGRRKHLLYAEMIYLHLTNGTSRANALLLIAGWKILITMPPNLSSENLTTGLRCGWLFPAAKRGGIWKDSTPNFTLSSEFLDRRPHAPHTPTSSGFPWAFSSTLFKR